ncbi:MAG: FAD binding domain-containing protein [Dehalococcoidia bacterium]
MRELEIHQPTTIDEAVRLMATLGDEAKVLAGGTALVLMYTQGILMPRYMVSLSNIPNMAYIRYELGTGLRLGAMTSHRAVECSAVVREKFPVLADVFHQVANARIRNQATVGGLLAEANYATDPPPVLIGLNAQVKVVGSHGERTLPMDGFIRGFLETSLAPDEIITEVVVPDMPANTHGAYLKCVTNSEWPCVGVAAVVQSRDGVCQHLRLVVSAVASTPQELREVEALARGQKLSDDLVREVARRYAEGIEPLSDHRGSSWYRKQIIEVLVRRAIQQAATGGEQ